MPISYISKTEIKDAELVKGKDIPTGVADFIKKEHPQFDHESALSLDELNKYKRAYLAQLITNEKKELNEIEQDVMRALTDNTFVSESETTQNDQPPSIGNRLADKIAEFGGSWAFILIFFSFLFTWMGINIWSLSAKPFDPYPFILLNLILSCLAAIQAPIIMMSQNRQEQKDRERAENDYKINLKAELEIKLLHEKIDHMIIQQNNKLLEIQQVQIDYLTSLTKQTVGPKS